ncbi:MAG TPA: 2-oxoacid:acceptor oxidoreductase subunit alpha [Candidatus Thermoplasmatota archaeon]|nr:2-oxoacid:acceptor oxidoreductase subunit alpha [Candidatus Thermoplasmatota archaeon]
MARTEVSIRIGGAAGDGVASTGEIFGKTLSRSGQHVYAYNSYQSVIRGGHVWFQVRGGKDPISYVGQHADVLIALNKQTVEVHAPVMREGGVVIFDPTKVEVKEGDLPAGVRACPMPLYELAKQHSPNPIMANTVAVGAAMQFIKAPIEQFKSVLEDQFGHKKADVVEANLKAAQAGIDYAREKWGPLDFALPYSDKRRVFLTGNQAIALGAIAAGCTFYTFYPMTPATSIGQFLADNGPGLGIVVKQCEDEISVVNMAIGGSYAGARSMCATSGGGFALIVEALGMAGILETPLVVALSQRSGPSTGLPTKTEQGDLNMVMGAGQGDYPRIVLAPRTVPEAFEATARAFHLADKWQTPVILLSDLLLSEHFETSEEFPMENVRIERGLLHKDAVPADYRRYQITESGVSARVVPGVPGGTYIAGSDEHDEDGTLVSDVRSGLPDAIEVRVQQMEKRMRKIEGARHDLRLPERVGPKAAPVTLVSWGSTHGAVREAMATLRKDGIEVASIEFTDIYPLDAEKLRDLLTKERYTLMIEGNYTGQLERLIRAETGWFPNDRLHKYDGEPFWPEEIVAKVKAILDKKEVHA